MHARSIPAEGREGVSERRGSWQRRDAYYIVISHATNMSQLRALLGAVPPFPASLEHLP